MCVIKGFVTLDYETGAWQTSSDFLHTEEAENLVPARPRNYVPQQSRYGAEGLEDSQRAAGL